MPVHQVICPYCNFGVFFESPLDFIFMVRRERAGYGREILIRDGMATKDEN